MRSRMLSLALAVAAGGATGCGSSQEVAVDAPRPLTQEEQQRMAPLLESNKEMMDAYRNRPEPPAAAGGAVQQPPAAGTP